MEEAILQNATLVTTSVTPTLFDTNQAAPYLGVTPHTLAVWRCNKRHAIPYIKVGRLVKYRPADLDIWLASRTVTDKSERDL